MLDYSALYRTLTNTPLKNWLNILPEQVNHILDPARHGDTKRRMDTLAELPDIRPSLIKTNSAAVTIGSETDCNDSERKRLEMGLHKLAPWRKGPYNFFGIFVDSEWRSDCKWQRLKNHIRPLNDKRVLDVGCGNGYHCWRMNGAGAKMTIGIDPYLLSVFQYHALQKYVKSENVFVLPLALEDLPDNLNGFDTVFSMGVLYHRRSPLDHLFRLKSLLVNGGELVLETLVIEGGEGSVLVPEDRYAKMRNVWFLPSCPTLESWLVRCGFRNIRLVDVTKTTAEEQRRTKWMRYESLSDFLHPQNPDRTVENLPAPRRAIFLAER